jgi:uncharacterized protein (TIGR03000 family)
VLIALVHLTRDQFLLWEILMRFRNLMSQLSIGLVLASLISTSNHCSAADWGCWGGGFGSRGYVGGGFRTPVRDFFAYRQPVRNLFRGVGRTLGFGYGYASYGGYGCAGVNYGCAGYQYSSGGYSSVGYSSVGYSSVGYSSVGYSSVGYSSVGYSSVGYSSVGYSSVGYSSVGYSSVGYSGVGYGSAGASTASYGGSAGFVSTASINTSYTPQISSPYCPDCVGSTAPAVDYGYGSGVIYDSSGGVISGNSSSILEGQSYDTGPTLPLDTTGESGAGRIETPPQPRPADGNDTTTGVGNGGKAVLTIAVPLDAKIFVNDRLTKTTGSKRSYVSRRLHVNQVYPFAVRAVVVRDGKEISIRKQVTLRAGSETQVDFDFDSPVLTQVTVKVPADARVMLCGNSTSATGSVRKFKTHLMPGKVWSDYEVEVSYPRDGQIVNEKRTLTIEAGEQYELDFVSGKSLYVSK